MYGDKKSGNLRGPEGRVKHLSVMLNKDKWTSKSPLIKEQDLIIYIDDDYKEYVKNDNYKIKELYWK